MPHWLIKSGVQRVISWLPASAFWNEIFQNHVTRSVVLTYPGFQGKLKVADQFLNRFRRHQLKPRESFTALEIGTGWYPTLPIAYYLSGASEVWTFDITSHLSRKRLALLLDMFSKSDEDGSLRQFIPSIRPERVGRLRELRNIVHEETPAECLARINIHAKVSDASDTGLPAGSIDFICSCFVLEYVPRLVLPKMLAEFRRLASEHSATVHRLGLADEFACFDASITEFNFLRYTDREWKWLESPLISVNRFRITDYRELLARAGFALREEENRSGSLEKLNRVKLAPEFQRYSAEDLLVLESLLTSVPAPARS
jgi:hypothetical protein